MDVALAREADRRAGALGPSTLSEHISINPRLTVQRLLGHSNPATTMIYLRYIEDTDALVQSVFESWNDEMSTARRGVVAPGLEDWWRILAACFRKRPSTVANTYWYECRATIPLQPSRHLPRSRPAPRDLNVAACRSMWSSSRRRRDSPAERSQRKRHHALCSVAVKIPLT